MICVCFAAVIMLVLSFTQKGKFNWWVSAVLLLQAGFFFWVQGFGRKIGIVRELGNESRGTLFKAGFGYIGSITLAVVSLVLSLTLFYVKYLQYNLIMAYGDKDPESFTKSYTKIKLLYNWAAIGTGLGAILFGISTYLFWKVLERNKMNLEKALMNVGIFLAILFATFAISRVMEVSQQEALHPAMKPLFTSGEMSFNSFCLIVLVFLLGFSLFANAASSKLLYFLAGLFLIVLCLSFSIKTAHSLRFVRQSVAPGEKNTRNSIKGLNLLHEIDIQADCRKYLPDGAGCEKSLFSVYWEGDHRTRSLDPACARASRVTLLYSVFVGGIFALLAFGFTGIVIYCAFFIWSDAESALINREFSLRAPEVQQTPLISTQTANQFSTWSLLASLALFLISIIIYFYGPSVNPLRQNPNPNMAADAEGYIRKDERYPLVPADFVAKINSNPTSIKFASEPIRLRGNLFVKSRDGKPLPVQPVLGQSLRLLFYTNNTLQSSLSPLSLALAGSFALSVPVPDSLSPPSTGTLVLQDSRGYFGTLRVDVSLSAGMGGEVLLPDLMLGLPSGMGCEDVSGGAGGGGYEAVVECQAAQGLVGPRVSRVRVSVKVAGGEGEEVAGARVAVYSGVFVLAGVGDGRGAIDEVGVGQDGTVELELRGTGSFTLVVRKPGFMNGRAVINLGGSNMLSPITLWLTKSSKSPPVMNIRLRVDNQFVSGAFELKMAFRSSKNVDCKLSNSNKYCGYSSFDDQISSEGNVNLQTISLWGLSTSHYIVYVQKTGKSTDGYKSNECKPWKLANTRVLTFSNFENDLQEKMPTMHGSSSEQTRGLHRVLADNSEQSTFFIDIDEYHLSKLESEYLVIGCWTGFGPLSLKYFWTPSGSEPTINLCIRPQSDPLSLESLQSKLTTKPT